MQKSNSRFTIALVIIIAIGLVIMALGVVGYQMQMIEVTKKVTANADTRKQIKELKEKLDKKGELKAELERNILLQGELDKDLTDVKYLPTYLEQIQKVAFNTGNDLIVINPGDIKPFDPTKGPFASQAPPPPPAPTDAAAATPAAAPKAPANATQVMKISLTINGTYTSLMKFLDGLRNFQKLVYVKSIAVTPSGIKDGKMQITTSIETYAIIIPSQNQKESDVVKAAKLKGGEAK